MAETATPTQNSFFHTRIPKTRLKFSFCLSAEVLSFANREENEIYLRGSCVAGASWPALPWAVCAQGGIQTYTVPKEQPAPAQPGARMPASSGMDSMPASDIPVNAAPIHWTTPATWQNWPRPASASAIFVVHGQDGAKAEAAIFSFPGSVGTELDNVNRWRKELKLPPCDGGQIYFRAGHDRFHGRQTLRIYRAGANSIVVASLPRNGATWFLKMRGDKDVVADAEPVFRDFLQSIHFNTADSGASRQPMTGPLLHGNLSATAPAESSGGEPKWTAPPNWSEKAPGPMIFKSYTAADDAGKTANVTISFFPGDVGGTFANVNRWRGPDRACRRSAGQTGQRNAAAGHGWRRGTLVDFTGTDSKTGQPGPIGCGHRPARRQHVVLQVVGRRRVVAAQKRDRFCEIRPNRPLSLTYESCAASSVFLLHCA